MFTNLTKSLKCIKKRIFKSKLDAKINCRLINAILKLSKIKMNAKTDNSDMLTESRYENYTRRGELERKNRHKLKVLFSKYSDSEIKNIFAFYYYGRSFLDGSISSIDSFEDFIQYHNSIEIDEIIRTFNNLPYHSLRMAWEEAEKHYHKHESQVKSENEKYDARIISYKKTGSDTYFDFGHRDLSKSTYQTFKNVFDQFAISETTDINIANSLISTIIKETTGLVIVDFLGYENFDHLDFVENDDEVLKLYWRYSSGNNKYPAPPHNTRVDIAFDKLELLIIDNFAGIVLKGYYKSKSEIKNYYYNKEKIPAKKFYGNIEEKKHSHFYYELEFDKKQRGSFENFRVTFLPWRYYNILIIPKENAPSVSGTTNILIIYNLLNIYSRCEQTIKAFRSSTPMDEDTITMYGNTFRKITESTLKFILLASKMMFKENYAKDMLGNILEQMKENPQSEYNADALKSIILLVEKTLIDKLNQCSHDNVQHKIDSKIVEDIYADLCDLFRLSYDYFGLKSPI